MPVTVFSDSFEDYAGTGEMLAAWVPAVPEGSTTATFTLDETHPRTGVKAALFTLDGSVEDGDIFALDHIVTGLTPGASYTFYRYGYPIGGSPPFPENQYNLFGPTVETADESGNLTLRLRMVIAGSGTLAGVTWWFDDVSLVDETASGVASFDDLIFGAGTLQIGDTIYKPSRGGWSFDPQKTIESWNYDGNQCAVVGTDVVASMRPVFRGTLMRVGSAELAVYESGETVTVVSDVETVTPPVVGASLAVDQLLADVSVRWRRFDGGWFRVRFPYGLVTKYQIDAKDKNEGEVAVEIEARAATAASPLYYLDRYA